MAVVDRSGRHSPVPYAMELPDRVPKQRYLDPDFFALEVEQLWPRVVADGVPARGDPGAARLRRVRVPRPVGHRPAHRRHGRRRVPERLPPPRREDRRGQWHLLRVGSGARSTGGATGSTARTPRSRSGARSPSTTWWRTTSTSCRCGARCGAGARGSTSTTTRRRCASPSSPRRRTSTRGSWSRCGPRSGTRAASR